MKDRQELNKLYQETIREDDAAKRLASMSDKERMPFFKQNKAHRGRSATEEEAEALMRLLTPAK